MGTIGLWPDNSAPDVVFDISLVHSEDLSVLVDFVNEGLVSVPTKIYLVAPNGYGSEDLLARYIHYRDGLISTHRLVIKESGEVRQAFLLWKGLMDALNNCDFSAATTLIANLAEVPIKLANRMGETLSLLQEYLDVCVTPIAEQALFRTFSASAHLPWWQAAITPLQDMDALYRKISGVSAGIPGVCSLSTVVGATYKNFMSMSGKQIALKFYDLSAFCFGLAQKQAAIGKSQTAFLLAYRSLDIFFQFLALSNSTMMETSSGVCYRANPQARVVLVDTEFALVQEQKLVTDTVRRDFLVRINRIRNGMLLTHGAHSVTTAEANSCLIECEKLVARMEGNSRWISRSRSFFPTFSDNETLLFSMISDIDTYIEEQVF